MLYLVKLFILRMLFIFVLSCAEVATLFVKKPLHYPVKWLNHFLKGSGRRMRVPDKLVHQAHSAMRRAVQYDDYGTIGLYGKWCVNHSTLYEGSGFYSRPTLFYLLGGFTFKTYEGENNQVMVSGEDYYDWHSTEDGDYFTSPLGDSKWMLKIIQIMDKIFGNDLFVIYGWPCGNAGISNKLWEEMYKVGAKSFYSYFEGVPFCSKEQMVGYKLDGKTLDKKEFYHLMKKCSECTEPVLITQNVFKLLNEKHIIVAFSRDTTTKWDILDDFEIEYDNEVVLCTYNSETYIPEGVLENWWRLYLDV